MVHFKLTQIIPYVFLEVLTYILGGYWYLLCETLSMSAMVLAEDFQEVILLQRQPHVLIHKKMAGNPGG